MSEIISLLYCFIVLSLILWSGRRRYKTEDAGLAENHGAEGMQQPAYLLLTGMLLLLFGNSFWVISGVVSTAALSGALVREKNSTPVSSVSLQIAGVAFILLLVMLPMLYLLFLLLSQSGSQSAIKPGTLLVILPALSLAIFGRRVLKIFYQYLMFSAVILIVALITGYFFSSGNQEASGGILLTGFQHAGTAAVLLALLTGVVVRSAPEYRNSHLSSHFGMSTLAVLFLLFMISRQKLLVTTVMSGLTENSPAAWLFLNLLISAFITVYIQTLSETAEELSDINHRMTKKIFRGDRLITYTITVLIVASALLLAAILCVRTGIYGMGSIASVTVLFSVFIMLRMFPDTNKESLFRTIRGIGVSGIVLLGVVLSVQQINAIEPQTFTALFFLAMFLLLTEQIAALPALLRQLWAGSMMRMRNGFIK